MAATQGKVRGYYLTGQLPNYEYSNSATCLIVITYLLVFYKLGLFVKYDQELNFFNTSVNFLSFNYRLVFLNYLNVCFVSFEGAEYVKT